MTDLATARSALAATLTRNIPGLHAAAHFLQVNTPAAVIEFDDVDYHDTMDYGTVWTFKVTVLVSANDVVAAQTALDAYLSPDSIRAALEDDPTLDGEVEDTTVLKADGYQQYDAAGETFLGVRFAVEVR